MRILVVEDEQALAKGLLFGLKTEGFETVWVKTGDNALKEIEKNGISLVLLDIRLPGIDGFEVCRRLRKKGHKIPVIMLTAKDEEIDKVMGLEIGADDYMVKPYSFRELTGRIRAQLRRCYGEFARQGESRKIFGSISVDLKAMRAYKDSEEIFLTPIEFKLLKYFLDNQDISLSREIIISNVWGDNIFLDDERTVDVHIRHLRAKLENNPSEPEFIKTVRGYGYRFVKKP